MDDPNNILEPPASDSFHIVGVGASAGGLDSFKRFLKAITVDSGMAYVLVQHLSPTHESLLPEILARETEIPVHEVTDEIHISPDNIYIIPENKILTTVDGTLRLGPRETSLKPNMPIDIFFDSLAETHKSFAIGVVLSGAGLDGTTGLKTIKEMGGSTFAQHPKTAAFDSMPKSAMRSEAVDFVLAPEDIPAQLLNIRDAYQSSHAHRENEPIPKSEEEVFRQILRILRLRTGNDFSHYKQATIRRRIARRMVITKREDPISYLSFLRAERVEQDALFNDILIPVSYFFRDSKTFDALSDTIIPQIVKNKAPGDKIRIWSAGCSTGEEAYSLGIKMHEFLTEKKLDLKVQIFASDISENVIMKARMGIYSIQDLDNVSESRLQQFFTKTAGSYAINKVIRDMCVFAVHSFVKDPPFAKLDLISCRNVLIYLDPFLQSKALTTFHYALKENGVLLLGKSETAGNAILFSPLVKSEKIYSRKPVPGHFTPTSVGRIGTVPIDKAVLPKKMLPSQPDFQKMAFDILFNKFTPAAVIVNLHKDVVYFHGDTSAFLRSMQGKPNFNILKMAREGLDFELRKGLLKVKNEHERVLIQNIAVKNQEIDITANVEIIPLQTEDETHYLILFCKNVKPEKISDEGRQQADIVRIRQLEAELEQIREDIRTVSEAQEAAIEELQSANEELLSGSEELQTLNEELETSSEELQSNNEELISVNDELMDRQEQLTAARNYAEAIITTIREPLIILDDHLRIKSANAAFYKLFDTSEIAIEGMNFLDIQQRQWDNPNLRRLLEELLPLQSAIENYEFTGEFAGIGKRTMLLNAKRIINEKYSDPLILLAIEDVTKSKLYKDQKVFSDMLEKEVLQRTMELERYNKELESYNYVASHDLQEPLRKIQLYNSRILDKERNKLSEESLKYFDSINGAAERMQKLIQALLAYSTSDSKNMPLRKTDLQVLFEEVRADLEDMVISKNATIIADPLPVAEVVPDQFRQLFLNLISNSIKYAKSDVAPLIKITAESVETDGKPFLKLRFSDNGIGFEQKYEHKIFELFQRLHGKAEFTGTGIGLAICKKIVTSHHGQISVESELGVGSAFTVLIPA